MSTYTVDTRYSSGTGAREVETSWTRAAQQMPTAYTRGALAVETGYGAAPTPPVTGAAYLLEDGTSALLLETGDLLLVEAGAATKISALTAAGTLTGAELLAVVQGGTTRALALAALAAWAIDQIAPITPPPVNATPPEASGTMRLGQTLTATDGTWSNTDMITYQWMRVGTPDAAISGATASTRVVDGDDMLCEVYCAVTATGLGGSTTIHTGKLSSPLKPIWDIDPDAAIWVRTAGWSVSVGSAEGAWSTADGRWTWAQASGSLKPTRSTTGLTLDGTNTWMSCDTLASRCNGSHTMVLGWTLTTDASTSARTIWCAASDDSGGSTYQISLNYSLPGSINTTRMRGAWADSGLTTLSLTSLGAKGNGPYLLAQVSSAQGSAARVESLDTPLVEVGSVTRPAGSATYEWLTLGARRLGAGPTVSQHWLGTVQSCVLLTIAASDAQLETVRDALAAEDAL